MSRLMQYQSSFTMGEFDPLIKGRVDIAQYTNALDKATNVICIPQGGVERRPGTQFLLDVTDTLGTGIDAQNGIRLVPFEFSTSESFMLCFVKISTGASNNVRMFVFYEGNQILNINSGPDYLPISLGNIDLDRMTFTQSADTLILIHPDLAPTSVVRGANNQSWTVVPITLVSPKYPFTPSTTEPSANITPSSIDGTATITSSSGIFTTDMVDQYIQVKNGFGRAKIIEYTSATSVKTNVEVPFFNTSAVNSGEWELEEGYEDVWSSTRGYPRSGTFHEGRLYFGGSKSLPSALFGSKVGDFFNFKESEGLDDDAVFSILSNDAVNGITGLRSGRDLQIFTTGNEFYVQQAEGDPITPGNLTIKAATKSGSKEGIMPVAAEGGTIFLQRAGKALREFLFSDVELSYQSNNISLLSSHLLKTPKKMSFRRATSTDDGDLLLIVNGDDGTIAAYSIHRTQKVVAPSELITDGTFEDCGVDQNDIYVIVKRTINNNTKYYVELLDDDRTTDCSLQLFDGSNDGNKPTSTTITGLSHLEGKTVEVVRDDIFIGEKTVSSGQITIDQIPTTYVELGLHYDVLIRTLPPEPKLPTGTMVGRLKRIVDCSPVLLQTQNLAINGNEINFRTFPNTLDTGEALFTGRKRITPILGYSKEVQLTINQTKPLFFTMLALEYSVSGSQ